jgi:hypothetical protein
MSHKPARTAGQAQVPVKTANGQSVDPANLAAAWLIEALSRLQERIDRVQFEPAVAGLMMFNSEWDRGRCHDLATVEKACGDALWWRAKVGRGPIHARNGRYYTTACEAICNFGAQAHVACRNAGIVECHKAVKSVLARTEYGQRDVAELVEACINKPDPHPWISCPALRALFAEEGEWGHREFRAGVLAAAKELSGKLSVDFQLLRAERSRGAHDSGGGRHLSFSPLSSSPCRAAQTVTLPLYILPPMAYGSCGRSARRRGKLEKNVRPPKSSC